MHQHVGLFSLLLDEMESFLEAIGHFLVLVVVKLEGELLKVLWVLETKVNGREHSVNVSLCKFIDTMCKIKAANSDGAEVLFAGDDLLAVVVVGVPPEHS